MQLEQIVMKARAFQAKVRRRRLLEYVAGAFGIMAFASYIYVFPGWMIKTGSVLVILATVNIFWQRHYRAAARRMPEAPAAALVDFYRSGLVRHRDAVGGSWLWEIVPALPGMALILLGLGGWAQVREPGVSLALDNIITGLGAIIVALILVIVVLVRRIRVYRLQKQIDELDRLRGAMTGVRTCLLPALTKHGCCYAESVLISLQLALCLLLHCDQIFSLLVRDTRRKRVLNTLQGAPISLHAFPAAFYVVRQLFRGPPASELKQGRKALPHTLFIPLHQLEEFRIIVWLYNVGAKVDALVADQ
jgi:hypothetical protein